MKIAFVALCSFLFVYEIPCFADPLEATLFTGEITGGAWRGQLDLVFSLPATLDVTHNFSKGLVCVDAGNTDDQSTCIRWGCWASFYVPIKAEVTFRAPGFTSSPATSIDTLNYGIPQNDCQNPALELSEAHTLRSVASLIMEGIQLGAGITTGVADAYVSVTLVPGTQPGSGQLTNFSYDQGTPQIAIAHPEIFLSEYRGTLTRVK